MFSVAAIAASVLASCVVAQSPDFQSPVLLVTENEFRAQFDE